MKTTPPLLMNIGEIWIKDTRRILPSNPVEHWLIMNRYRERSLYNGVEYLYVEYLHLETGAMRVKDFFSEDMTGNPYYRRDD